MGGLGSGRSASYGFLVDKCEDFLRIDLAFLRMRNALIVGNRGQLSWNRRGKQYASIRYVVEPTGICLIYRTRSRGGDWQDVSDLIPFIETPTQFGGQRQWFICPSVPSQTVDSLGRANRSRCRYEDRYHRDA